MKPFSQQEDKIIVEAVKNNSSALKEAFKLANILLLQKGFSRSNASITQRWYKVLSKKKTLFVTTQDGEKLPNVKNKVAASVDFVDGLVSRLSKEQKQKLAFKLLEDLI